MVMNNKEEKYKFLEHTADAKFQAFGKDLEEAFENAALAMFAILKKPEEIKPVVTHEIRIKSESKEALLYDFLEELLMLLDTDSFLLSEVKVEIDEVPKQSDVTPGFTLSAVAKGDKASNYTVGGNIKSITYNDMFIKEEKDKVAIQAVVDL